MFLRELTLHIICFPIQDCDEVTILLGAQTSYRCEDYKGQAVFDVERAEEKTYAQLKADHIADYKSYYDRANISLCDNSSGNSTLPTDERLVSQFRQISSYCRQPRKDPAYKSPRHLEQGYVACLGL